MGKAADDFVTDITSTVLTHQYAKRKVNRPTKFQLLRVRKLSHDALIDESVEHRYCSRFNIDYLSGKLERRTSDSAVTVNCSLCVQALNAKTFFLLVAEHKPGVLIYIVVIGRQF